MNVLIVDDQKHSREACRSLLPGLGDNPRVLEVATIAAALERRADFLPALVLLNFRLRGDERCRGIAALRLAHPTGIIVVVCGENDPIAMRQCIKAGAAGYVCETAAAHVLLRSLQLALEGVVCLPRDAMTVLDADEASLPVRPDLSCLVTDGDDLSGTSAAGTPTTNPHNVGSSANSLPANSSSADSLAVKSSTAPATSAVADSREAASGAASTATVGSRSQRTEVVLVPDNFSTRQRDSLRLAIKGLPNKIIAKELGISVGTVKFHLHAGYKLLGVRNRTEASVRVAQLDLTL